MAAPLPLRTDRLTLRPFRADDTAAFLPIYAEPEVARFLLDEPWTEDITREKVAERLPRTGLDSPERALSLVVEHEGEVIGDVAAWLTDDEGHVAEIGWVFGPSAGGKGLATEAATAVLEVALAHPGLHRVEAQMDARNTPSARLCERLGMTREAHLRSNWWSKGEWTDTVVYGIVEGETVGGPANASATAATTTPDPKATDGVVGVVPDLQVPDLAAATTFWRDVLGFEEESLGLDWVTRLVVPGARVQLLTRDATAPEAPVATVKVRDVDAAYERARRDGCEIVHPLTTEPWGVRRFLVRAPGGHVLNVARHRE